MAEIFLTGATGYIGGQVLHELAADQTKFSITALVRDESKAKIVAGAYPHVKIVLGALEDDDIIEKEASQAEIVLHLAATNHLQSVKTIHKALLAREGPKPAYWIQVSGASVLAEGELASKTFVPGSSSSEIFDDIADATKLRGLIRAHPSRAVENYVLDVAKNSPGIKTALVFPPIIYGHGQGLLNQRSFQIPELAKITLERGHGVRVGQGLNRWGNVHIQDVASLFSILAQRAAEGESDEKVWNEEGVYLTGVGEQTFADIAQKVQDAAVQQGLIKEGAKVEVVNRPEADTVLPNGSVLFGTNARSNARRATELLGWKPSLVDLDTEIPKTVADEATKLRKP